MSLSTIPEAVRYALWGKAGGRCEYRGCNKPLWKDALTQAEFNQAYIAHIVADSPGGPRGDPVLSPRLCREISNLMLLCDAHHRLIDKVDVAGHPASLLTEMKAEHETRIELQTEIAPQMKSEVLYYGANIGEHPPPLEFQVCAAAMIEEGRYPASDRGIGLGVKQSAVRDRDPHFWDFEEAHLRRQFSERVKPRMADGSVQHLSVFALAPQPLLMLMGYLLSDLPNVDVYQRRREPPDWRWPDNPTVTPFLIDEPADKSGPPALVLSLSATITDDRISEVLGARSSIWRVRVASPHHDVISSRQQLSEFRRTIRPVLDRIKMHHGGATFLAVFPAVPVSTAVEFGRVIQPKADMPVQIYDQQQPHGFVAALALRPAV